LRLLKVGAYRIFSMQPMNTSAISRVLRSSERPLLYLSRGAAVVALICASLWIMTMWIYENPNQFRGEDRYRIWDTVNGTVDLPFAYRQLMPIAARALGRVIDAVPGLETRLERGVFSQFTFEYFTLERRNREAFLLAAIVDFALLIGFTFIMRALCRRVLRYGEFGSAAGALLSLFVLPVFFAQGTHYIYDFGALTLCAAMFLAMSRAAWAAYLVLFALAMLNKETAVLMIIPFAVYGWTVLPKKKWLLFAGAQVIIAAAVRAVLYYYYLNTPGVPMCADDSFNFWNMWEADGLYLFNFLVPRLFIMLVVLANFFEKPLLLRAGALLTIPLFIGYVIGGQWGEFRVFYEVYPILFLLAYSTFMRWLGFEPPGPSRGRLPEALEHASRAGAMLLVVWLCWGMITHGPSQRLRSTIRDKIPRVHYDPVRDRIDERAPITFDDHGVIVEFRAPLYKPKLTLELSTEGDTAVAVLDDDFFYQQDFFHTGSGGADAVEKAELSFAPVTQGRGLLYFYVYPLSGGNHRLVSARVGE
jgi:hypothetical protein